MSNIYAIELHPDVLKHKKVLKLNPNYDPNKTPLYVGMTGLPIEERFKKHKAGLKANMFVKNYGLGVKPELSLTGLTFQEAEDKEVLLAKKLRDEGHLVIGGNPQTRQLKKRADWTEFDEKRKREMEPLQPQQERVVKKIQRDDTSGLVLFHGVGGGKSKTSIEAYKALGMPTDVIVPSALKDNYRKELIKWLGNVPANVNIVSQQRFANPKLKTPLYDNGLQITDEAQKLHNINTELYQRLSQTHPKKRLLLSATPMSNSPAELGTLVNLAAGKDLLPTNPIDFKKQYFKQEEVQPGLLGKLTGVSPGLEYKLQNKNKLKGILDKYVDYYNNANSEGYPSITEQEINVPMGPAQQNIYNAVLGKSTWWNRYKVKHNIPPGKGELDSMKAFLTGPRQISNTTAGYTTDPKQIESPKIDAAFKFLQSQIVKDKNYKGLVYSPYLKPLKEYESRLTNAGIPFGEFSGEVSPALRNQAVKDYNADKLRALLISGAGAEGLDLKNTRLSQLLGSEWTMAKERQVIGRARRFHSHEGLPPEKRNILVQRYFAEPKPSLLDRFTFNSKPTGTDAYVHNMAKKKDQINQEVVDLIDPSHQHHWWDM